MPYSKKNRFDITFVKDKQISHIFYLFVSDWSNKQSLFDYVVENKIAPFLYLLSICFRAQMQFTSTFSN